MASPTLPNANGTSPAPSTFSEAPQHTTSPTSSETLNMEVDEQNEDTHTDQTQQGRPAMPTNPAQAGSGPHWNPASLLNPKGATSAIAPTPSRMPPPNIPAADPAVLNGTDSISFQFSSTNDDLGQAVMASAPSNGHVAVTNGQASHQAPNGVGASNMLDRVYNLEDRTTMPAVKRRKLDASTESQGEKKQQFTNGSSGMLANHIKEAPVNSMALKRAVTVDLTEAEDDDLIIVDKPKEEEVCFGMLEAAKINCHKMPSPKPGVRALSGPSWWPPVKVVLRRRDGDKSINIPVFDHTRAHIGKIDAKTSTALCPLMDASGVRLRVDARIPQRRKGDDEAEGQPCSKVFSIELTLYGPLKYAKAIGRLLSEKGVSLINPVRLESGFRTVNPHAPVPGLMTAPASARFNQTQQQQPPAPPAYTFTRTVEEIRSEVIGIFDTMAKADELPEMEPHPRITTPLLKHQKQALSFMTARETPSGEQDDATRGTSIWQKKPGHQGHYYYNVITGDKQRHPPNETLGGILADMMGLGKTLSILSLIASTMDKAEAWRNLDPVQPRQPPEPKKSNAAKSFSLPQAQGLDLTKVISNGKATLLVCPLSTITNWEEQIKQHVQPQTLNYHIYHGANRKKDPEFLSKCDLVITTYGSVSSEVSARKKRKPGQYPLEEISWFRIVLDEGHMIREQNTLLFKAICRLQASRRWAVTGTPVQNKLEDLGSILAFLRLQPFDARAKFATHILAPFKGCDPEIIPKIRILVDSITLRRLKDKIDLPPKTDELVKIEFSDDEQRLYDIFEQSAKERVQILTSHQETSMGRKTYIHVLQSICRLRKICCHGKDLLNDEDLQILKGTEDAPIELEDDDGGAEPALSQAKAYELFDLMVNTDADNCEGCQRKLGSIEHAESEKQEDLLGYMTSCLHVLCPDCIGNFQDEDCGITHTSNRTGQCPFCQKLVNFMCQELRRTVADAEHDELSNAKINGGSPSIIREYTGPHTKVRKLLGDLDSARMLSAAQNPDEPPIKSVVFSQWTSNLDLIEKALDAAGYKYTRLDGKMTRPARTFAMDTFREDPTVTVILVSITAGGLGLNLTAASQVFVMEPQFNPAAEAQAIDRVHRLGQKKPVRCVRYIMSNSFEEKMLDLQRKKRELANISMERKDSLDKAGKAKQKLEDLRTLFK